MKLTYNWLKDFVDIKISAEELAYRLTMAGLEVVSLEKKEGDFILELEITPNRSDCLSVMGIAREVAAITNSKLQIQNEKFPDKKVGILTYRRGKIKIRATISPLKIEIEDKKDCPLYTARLINNVKVNPSPKWLMKRLENVGERCVNSIVDITNYVLLETGQPLHAFDYDKLKGRKIIVRRARDGEKITTIDGIERELNEEILVISDSQRPIAIAGIMGGKEAEVTKDTKNVLLESAEFNPLIVRRGRRHLGLVTESSYRFERGTDKSNLIFASYRAAELIKDLARGKLRSFKIEGDIEEKTRFISLNKENVKRILGKVIPNSEIKKILKGLKFEIREEKEKLKVFIPPFRKDIKEEIDLIEEIARIYGYDNIPLSLPYIKVTTPKTTIQDKIKDTIKSTLLKIGLNEVITYSLTDPDYFKEEEFVRITNPLSKDFSILRPDLLFSLLKVLKFNVNRGCDSVGIFELAKTYKYKKDLPKEFDVLGILVFGRFYSDWLRGQIQDYSFFDLKGIIEVLLKNLGIEDYEFKDSQIPHLSQAAIFGIKENQFGFLGEVNIKILDRFDLRYKSGIYFAQIYLENLESFVHLEKGFKSLPTFPSIRRDISLIVKKSVTCEEILEIIREKGGELLSSVTLFDRYKEKPVPEDSVSLAFSLEYRSKEKTLTDEEIDSLHKGILEALKERLMAKIR